jgi:hypothetical protein
LTVEVPGAVAGTDCHGEVTADDDRLLLSARAEDVEGGRTDSPRPCATTGTAADLHAAPALGKPTSE